MIIKYLLESSDDNVGTPGRCISDTSNDVKSRGLIFIDDGIGEYGGCWNPTVHFEAQSDHSWSTQIGEIPSRGSLKYPLVLSSPAKIRRARKKEAACKPGNFIGIR